MAIRFEENVLLMEQGFPDIILQNGYIR